MLTRPLPGHPYHHHPLRGPVALGGLRTIQNTPDRQRGDTERQREGRSQCLCEYLEKRKRTRQRECLQGLCKVDIRTSDHCVRIVRWASVVKVDGYILTSNHYMLSLFGVQCKGYCKSLLLFPAPSLAVIIPGPRKKKERRQIQLYLLCALLV